VPWSPRHHDDGQSTIEFAVVLPLLITFLLAFLDIMSTGRDQLLVDVLARDAARRASTAMSIAAAHNEIAETVSHSSRNDAHWSATFVQDRVEVVVTLVPRTSLVGSSLRWLGSGGRVVGRATFATEYELVEQ